MRTCTNKRIKFCMMSLLLKIPPLLVYTNRRSAGTVSAALAHLVCCTGARVEHRSSQLLIITVLLAAGSRGTRLFQKLLAHNSSNSGHVDPKGVFRLDSINTATLHTRNGKSAVSSVKGRSTHDGS